MVDIAPGKTILIKLLSVGSPNEEGNRTLFFKVNGQNRSAEIFDRSLNITIKENRKVTEGVDSEIGAPLPGKLIVLNVKQGDKIEVNDSLFVVEAMKMENAVLSQKAGVVKSVILNEGEMVSQNDLILIIE